MKTFFSTSVAIEKKKVFSSVVVVGFAFLLLGAGCASRPAVPQETVSNDSTVDTRVGYDAPFSLGVGQTVSVAGELRVTLVRMTDSRCPKDVVCIQAGERGVELVVTVENGGETESVLLGEETGKKKTVFLHELSLVSLDEMTASLLVAGTPVVEQQEPGEE